MSQHDYVIDNQLFPATRTDINNALSAIATLNSGASAPSTPYSFQIWVDTSSNPATIRQRNSGNTAWIVVGTADTTNWGLAPTVSPGLSGTPTAPTASTGTSTAQIANCAFVQNTVGTNPAWISATLLNSFANVGNGFVDVAYRKMPWGEVQVRGSLTRGTVPASGTVAFNLPAGYRPSAVHRFYIQEGSVIGFDVRADGDVAILMSGSTNANPCINHISFSV